MSCSILSRGACAAVVALCAPSLALATDLPVTVNVGTRAASALFHVSGSNLIVTLTNTSTVDLTEPAFILTALFFDVTAPDLSLTRTSAIVAAGSSVIGVVSQPAGGVVGGEWAYLAGLSGAPHGAAYGISSSGLGLFGAANRFPGANLDGPDEPDGPQYGITTAGDNPTTHNGGADTSLIKNSVVFTLGGLPEGFDPSTRITNISFQYGTGLDEPNLLVPAPGALGLFGLGALALRRRRR
jgi:hypothetical protein